MLNNGACYGEFVWVMAGIVGGSGGGGDEGLEDCVLLHH